MSEASVETPGPLLEETRASDIKERAHIIDIESLIVHKYAAPEVLLRKADKLARELISKDLRPGEFMRSTRLGRYQLVFPKLRPDAGALRASVIAEALYRAIRELNPAAQAEAKSPTLKSTPDDPGANKPPAVKPATVRKPSPSFLPKKASRPDDYDEEAMRKVATQAIEKMTSGLKTKAEELLSIPGVEDELLDMSLRFQPIWNAKKGAVSCYRAVLTALGGEIDAMALTAKWGLPSIDFTNAILDAYTYRAACAQLAALFYRGEQAGVVVPIHFSTVDRSRFIGAYLDAGSPHFEATRNYITFELCDLPPELSRYRLREAVAYLRNRCRGISVSLDLSSDGINFGMFKEMGINSAGITVRTLAGAEARLMRTLEQFAAKCESAGLMSYSCDLPTFSLLSCAVAAGFSCVGGRAVAPLLDAPHAPALVGLGNLVTMIAKDWRRDGSQFGGAAEVESGEQVDARS